MLPFTQNLAVIFYSKRMFERTNKDVECECIIADWAKEVAKGQAQITLMYTHTVLLSAVESLLKGHHCYIYSVILTLQSQN